MFLLLLKELIFEFYLHMLINFIDLIEMDFVFVPMASSKMTSLSVNDKTLEIAFQTKTPNLIWRHLFLQQ